MFSKVLPQHIPWNSKWNGECCQTKTPEYGIFMSTNTGLEYVEIKCQLDATEVFIADLIACSTCFGYHYSHRQELKSTIASANRTHNPQLCTRPAT